MRATNALADRNDYADYSFAAQQSGLPWEAVAVIDEGRNRARSRRAMPTRSAPTPLRRPQ
jgi:hypothetical protein